MTTTTKVPIVGDLTDDQLFALAARWARAWIGQTGSDPIVDEDDLSQEISTVLFIARKRTPGRSLSSIGWATRSEVRVMGSPGKRAKRIAAQLRETPEWQAASPQEREAMYQQACRREKTRAFRPIIEQPLLAFDPKSTTTRPDDEAAANALRDELVRRIHLEIDGSALPGSAGDAPHAAAHRLLDAFAAGGDRAKDAGLPARGRTEGLRILRRASTRVTGRYSFETLPGRLRVSAEEEAAGPSPTTTTGSTPPADAALITCTHPERSPP